MIKKMDTIPEKQDILKKEKSCKKGRKKRVT